MTAVRFTVLGKPEAGGSKRAFIVKGRAIVTDANKNAAAWKQQIRQAAATVMHGPLWTGAVKLVADIYFARPRSHYTKSGALKKGVALQHCQKPDALKVSRLLEDALTGVVYVDDAQIVEEHLRKWWTTQAGGIQVSVEKVGAP